ncbi:MAG: SCP2 sterol-binding domain-containing protein [Gammaproteobacteria bacterium]|jgi:ubiquinone biosynthesis protein UbiJ|nr:SCP2 sterol-binding domain-containing protein [Gammaproteobacteria bacterium]
MKLPAILARNLESAFNRYLAMDPDARTRLEPLDDRTIALELRGFDLVICLQIKAGRVTVLPDPVTEPDTTLRGTPLGFARLGFGDDSVTTLFSGDVSITGDVETGQAFKAVLDELDIDWEEQLAGITGDIVAHQLGNAARSTGNWLRQGRNTLAQDMGEYLQEELRVLPTRIEIENFIGDVDRLHMDLERLDARIRRLRASQDVQ